MPRYRTVQEVAADTSLTVKVIRGAIQRGDLPAVRPKGQRRLLITDAALDAWMEPVEPSSTPAPTTASAPRPLAAREVGSRDRLRAIERSC